MASPFALVQEGEVVLRTEPLRFFLYDHIQELRASCRSSSRYFLNSYELLKDGALDQQRLKSVIDQIAGNERDIFLYHEIGELLEESMNGKALEDLIRRFPGSVIELVSRAVRDGLADTHPQGTLAHIVREDRASSLGLFVSFANGLREELLPELGTTWQKFVEKENWEEFEKARLLGRKRLQGLATSIEELAARATNQPDHEVQQCFNETVLTPLGLRIPDS
jgi:hypothetical protein